jgi:ABC-2 type transport system permease protein
MRRVRWGLIRRQMAVQFLVATLNPWTLVLFVFQPAVFVAVGMLLSRSAGNAMPDLVYSVIGGGIMGMWSGLVFTSTFDITGDRIHGTLEMIVGSPTSLGTVEAIRTLTNVLAGLFSLALAFTAAMAVFGYSLQGVNAWGAVVSLLLLLMALWCIGVFLANFLAWSRVNRSFVDYLEMPIAFLCGFMYPIRVLPGWLQSVAGAVPIRWALEALNESLLGNHDLAFLAGRWGMSILLSVLCILVTRWLQSRVEDAIRLDGSLSSI